MLADAAASILLTSVLPSLAHRLEALQGFMAFFFSCKFFVAFFVVNLSPDFCCQFHPHVIGCNFVTQFARKSG